ncbi:MAG: hypothetical protein AAFW73_17335 [Bacteroidota bacterium]
MVGVKLKASTLVETLAAMTLLMVAFGIGMSIYLNILSSDHLERTSKANLYLQQFLEESKREGLFYDDEKVIGGYRLSRTIEPAGEYGDAYLINIEAEDIDGNFLHRVKEIVYVRTGPNETE